VVVKTNGACSKTNRLCAEAHGAQTLFAMEQAQLLMGGGSTKQCGALFCLTQTCLRICRLLYPKDKDKTAKAKTFGASGRQLCCRAVTKKLS
jgi:hypothetical protein